jgi:hypothetical protein
MPPEPRRPDPSQEATFAPPVEVRPVRVSLTDILTHLMTNAQDQSRVTAGTRRDQGMDPQRIDELNQRLENVRRLTAELQAELTSLEELRPADGGGPFVT